MEELQISLTPEMLALVPVVAAIIQVLKKIPSISKIAAWMPFAAIGIAMLLAYGLNGEVDVLPSVVLGLTASGAYDLLRAPTK